MNVASPVPLVRVVVIVMSLVAKPVTDLENLTGTSNVSAVCVSVGSSKLTVATVVSKLIASVGSLIAGPVRVPSVTAFFATSNVIVPFAAVGDVTSAS